MTDAALQTAFADPADAMRRIVHDLPPSAIREIAHLGMETPGCIALYFGEPDVPTPAFVRDAGAEALRAGDTFYQPNRGLPALRDALATYMSGLYAQPFERGHVTVTVSGLNGLLLALQCIVDAGDHVVTTVPLWPNLIAMPRIMGADVSTVALEPRADGWRLDLDRLFESCTAKTRVILLNSPNNPTGWMMSAEEQRALLDFARARGIWLLADEVYSRIVYESDAAPSFLSLMTDQDRLVVVNSFSKSWAMTGWRLGWITAPPTLGPQFEKMMEFNISCPPGFAQRAGIAAVEQGEPFIAEQRARYKASRDLLFERLGALPRVRLPRPEAAFYGFFAVDGVADTIAFAKQILQDTAVGLAPGEAFGPAFAGYLRACYAVDPARLSEAIDRLTPALS